jgi:hypothetical protein
MAGFEPNLLEEGLILHVAERMMAGEHLYRDVASFTGPLPFELLANLFRVFGAHMEVARAVVVLLHGLACASIYALAAGARAGALAHAAAACVVCAPVLLFPLLSMYFHTTLAFVFSLIAAWPALRALDSDRWAVTAGVLVGCAALCKQTLGVALALGLLAAIATGASPGRRIRAAAGFVAGGVALAVVTLGFYALRGELGLLVDSIVVLPLSFDETFATPFINLWPPGYLVDEIEVNKGLYFPSLYTITEGVFGPRAGPIVLVTQILYALPFAALALTAIRRLRGPLPAGIWIHAAVVAALATNLFPRTDWGHVVFAIAPACVQLLLLAPMPAPGRARVRRWVAAATMISLLIGTGLATLVIWTSSRPSGLGPRVSPRPVTGMVRSRSLAQTLKYLRERLEPGDAIFVARSEPLLYFATGARNPTPYSGVIPGMREEQEATILEALGDVRYVVMSDIDQDLYTWYRDELPGVQKHLERHFQVPNDLGVARYTWLAVLEPGPDRGPTAIDLFDRGREARAWTRDIRGAEETTLDPRPTLVTKMNRRPLGARLGPRGGGLDFEVTLPEGAIFESGIGIHALVAMDGMYGQADRCRFQLSVSTADGFTLVKKRDLDESRRRWTPFRADLSAYGGKRVTLRLEAIPLEPPFDTKDLAFWGSPRIATASGG